VDPAVALGIAVLIGVLAVRIFVRSFHVLTDRAVMPPEAIGRVVRGIPEVRDCRDVRTRGGADAVYVDMIVHLDGALTLREAHDVADRIEEALKRAHPRIVDVVVHLEPAGGADA
jgi:divalent metal cation (Fe/Co/Zn/Cd) transporter